MICKTVGLCKSRLVDIPSKIDEIITEFDIDLCEIDAEVFIRYVCQALRMCKEQTNVVDFNDMIWLCFVYRINPGKFDIVFIDECQDLTRAQLELALSAVKIDGRVIAVLDDRQVLYSFAGVEIDVLDILRSRLKATELTLPICYRCPKSVITLAQKYVPDILPFDKVIEGSIEHITYNDLYHKVSPGCFVLSRTNAPLISICMRMIRSGIKANILGRDIGDGLQYLIKKSKKKTVIKLLEWLPKWEKEEKERVLAKNPKAKTEFITDKAECLFNLCENCTSLEEVKDNINKMFKDTEDNKVVWLSTIHKRKGAETDVVFILNDTLRYSSIAEENCNYVAITRCKKELYFVSKSINS
jgi:superfamily I DNA/RNA helicase